MSLWLRYLLVFAIVAVNDGVWALYVRFASSGRAMPAAVASLAIFMMGSCVTLSYVHDPWCVMPAAVGGFVGTFVAVKYGRKESK